MTTFEITVIALLAIITLMVIILVKTAIGGFHDVWQKLDTNCETLSNIRGDTVDIFQKLNDIEDNILDDLRDIRLADKIVGSGFQNGFPPCYAPNGICTNPQMDCINCPKRGTGGTWSTSTNKIKED